MASTPHNSSEEKFRNRNELFRDFYHLKKCEITEEEQDSITPILNSVETYNERYEVLSEIAEGGEKIITLVHDHRLDRQVAMAHGLRTDSKEAREQFLREARLTANLAHPNIMPVHNMGLDPGGVPFFTMELVTGDSLKDIIKKLSEGDKTYRQSYPLETLLNIYLKICDAIAYAHSLNVLHLDIKPDNIRVGEFGEVFVCDWGLAKVMHVAEPERPQTPGALNGDILNDLTLSGIMKGTPGFMAPEQTVADGKTTPQTDLYALGSMLYMLLTYETPIRGESANEVLQNTREGKVEKLHLRGKDRKVPKGLAAVTMKALSFKAEDRYRSAPEQRQEISRYLSGYPTLAENAGLATTLSLLMKRHSRIAFLLVSFLLLLAGVMSVNLTLINKEKAIAEAEHAKANRHLELYRKEQQEVVLLNTDLRNALISTIKSPVFLNSHLTIKVLEIGISKDIEPKEYQVLMVKKGTLHFLKYEFNAANRCFNEAGDAPPIQHIEKICNLSEKYAKLKPNDRKPLTNQQLADLIDESGHTNIRTSLILYYMYLGQIRRDYGRSPNGHPLLTRAMLDKLNNIQSHDKSLELIQREKGYHLNLTNTKYKFYTLKIDASREENVLRPLNLYSLDISHSPIADISELAGIKLKELRMVGMDFPHKNLPSRLEKLGIEKLTIDADAYPAPTMNKIRKIIEVINEPKKP